MPYYTSSVQFQSATPYSAHISFLMIHQWSITSPNYVQFRTAAMFLDVAKCSQTSQTSEPIICVHWFMAWCLIKHRANFTVVNPQSLISVKYIVCKRTVSSLMNVILGEGCWVIISSKILVSDIRSSNMEVWPNLFYYTYASQSWKSVCAFCHDTISRDIDIESRKKCHVRTSLLPSPHLCTVPHISCAITCFSST